VRRFSSAIPLLLLISWASLGQPERCAGVTASAYGGNIEESGTEAVAMTIPGKNYSFGSTQVKKMLEDRIQMAAYPAGEEGMRMVTESDAIFIWLANQFSDWPDCMILWNPDPPVDPAMGDDVSPTKTSIGFIRIREVYPDGSERGNYLSFEELWHIAVYESISVNMAKPRNDLFQQVQARTITRSDFILASAHLEFEASLNTKEFTTPCGCPGQKRRTLNQMTTSGS